MFSTAADNFIFMYTLMAEVIQCKQILLTGSFSVSAHGSECVRIQQCGLGYFGFYWKIMVKRGLLYLG